MKRTILIMATFAMLASCKNNADEIAIPENIEKLSPDIELMVKGTTQETPPLYPWSKNYDFLGFGYDVTDQFNDQASVRASVIDIPTYDNSQADRVISIRGTEGSWRTIQANNAVELSEKLSNTIEETKGLKLFGNTIEKTFPGTVATDKKYIYGYYSNYMVWKRYALNPGLTTVNNFLTTDFKRDITLLSAQELVHKYGTHVLTAIELGSKFDVVYQAEAPEEGRNMIVMEGLRYAIKRTFGLMTGHLDEVNLRNLNANSSAKLYYSSIGGDVSKLKTETIKSNLFLNITNWNTSRTEDNARFIGVYKNGVEPLDRFIDDHVKKAEVKSYLEQYFAAKTVKLKN